MKIADLSKKRSTLAFAALMVSTAVLFLWKMPFGLPSPDECFYITLPMRFLQGDLLLTEEWHGTQFAGLLTIPVMLLYDALGLEDGAYIVLLFRLAYTIVHLLISVFIYRCIKGSRFAVISMILYMLYAPFNIMALSYNSMGIMFLTAALAAMYKNSTNALQAFFGGVFFAAAVLCCPLLAFLYIIYLVLWLVSLFRKKAGSGSHFPERDLTKVFLAFTAGCAILAAGTIALILRSPLEDIIRSIPYILSDPEHLPVSLWEKIKGYVLASPKTIPQTGDLLALNILLLLASFIFSFISKKDWIQDVLWAIGGILAILYLGLVVKHGVYINFLLYPIAVYGCISFVSSKKKDIGMFFLFYIPAILYTYFIHALSNQAFYAISSASVVASIPSIYFIFTKAQEVYAKKDHGRLLVIVPCCVMLFASGTMLYSRISQVFHENFLSRDLSYRVESGYSKGLYSTEDQATLYYALLDDTDWIRQQKDGKVLYINKSGLYLMDEKPIAAYSGWLGIHSWDADPDISMLKQYYLLHPDNRPKYIYINSKSQEFMEAFCNALDINCDIIDAQLGRTLIVHSMLSNN